MKWLLLLIGVFLAVMSGLFLSIGMGVTFTHGGYEVWDDHFYDDYRACCLMTDLKTAAPFAVTSIAFFVGAGWFFFKK